MVRPSLVNLYLHGFADPHIIEYDSLTSQERWNETADVILANPPFMSPKGGIKPHNRFSVQSKRSEVLFVDYMAEHVSANGRAGIIVPEGVIFQSQTAYKKLRKMLVDESLVAVVSLPAGLFQPYSGVKTSILILDKSLAKRSASIGFFKISNDGFGLGAQRRVIDKNDLPQAQAEIGEYLRRLRAGESVEDFQPTLGLIVAKEKVAAGGDYNLSRERYRDNETRTSTFPLRQFQDVCTLEYGASLPKEKRIDGAFPVVGSNGITGYHNAYLVEGPTIVVGRKGSAGEVTFIAKNCFPIDTTYYVKQTDPNESDIAYLYWILKGLNLPALRGGAGIPGLNRTDVYQAHRLPLPPLDVQQEIAAEIEGYQNVIDGARAVLDNYRPHISIASNWPMMELGEACDVRDGTHDSPTYVLEGYPLITSKNLKDGFIDFTNVNLISRADLDAIYKRSKVDEGDLLMPMIGTIGNPVIADSHREYAVKNVALIKFPKGCQVDNQFLRDILRSAAMQSRFQRQASGSTQKFISIGFIRKLEIPLPPLATQQASKPSSPRSKPSKPSCTPTAS
jgi:type I restriction enzyme M protein